MGKEFYTKKFLDKQQKQQVPGVENGAVPETKMPELGKPKTLTRKPVQKPKPKSNNFTQLEIEQLTKRFSDISVKEDGPNRLVRFKLPITDPDFPYDLDAVELNIWLPSDYPKDRPKFKVMNHNIPDTLKERIENRMNTLVKTLKEGELSVRPMLKYLENNLEAIVSAKTFIKIIRPEDIQLSPSECAKPVANCGDEDVDENQLVIDQKIDNETNTNNIEELKVKETRFEKGSFIKLSEQRDLGPGSHSIEAVLIDDHAEFNLAVCSLLNIAVVCSKCSHANEVYDVRPETERIEKCARCKRQFSFVYHPQYVVLLNKQTTIAKLRFSHCRPLDMMPSQWHLECTQCEASVRVNKVSFGERITCPCFKCASLLKFGLSGCRWTEDQTVHASKVKQQSLSVVIGEPLPRYGACDHYPKSFRWYRFPCCGRVFPCDKCHDEECAMSGNPHEMQWATRFVCGFCSREQHINNVNKTCVCGVDPKQRRTAHWEGGKGMRDQQAMSRKDNKKYRGLTKQ